jgi:hypothetical protein
MPFMPFGGWGMGWGMGGYHSSGSGLMTLLLVAFLAWTAVSVFNNYNGEAARPPGACGSGRPWQPRRQGAGSARPRRRRPRARLPPQAPLLAALHAPPAGPPGDGRPRAQQACARLGRPQAAASVTTTTSPTSRL